ncbi:Emopamil-binding protein [Polychaeton citri CBS 116435]|uniref:Emopamil-binding protein n=1 Tax=Polychaeton citri CBS 116435 TaxID=1314669 RepID=A0A9P4UQ39_9PEZI|nr:Emopamil-binding protein [Polychaeton citri CBS 116435]
MDTLANAAANATQLLTKTPHPYYPLDLDLPLYEPNDRSMPELLSVFFGASAYLFSTTYFLAKWRQPTLTKTELFTVMWFALSGAIHIFFEGYYVRNFVELAGQQTWIAQMWKEYANGDSRYLTQDAQVLCLESVTAVFWGPMCWLVAVLIVLRHPMRFPLQCIVSVGQFYGDFLYYAFSVFDHVMLDITYSRPEAFYFWFYYFFMNFIWLVVPGLLIYQSCVQCANAISIAQRTMSDRKVQ